MLFPAMHQLKVKKNPSYMNSVWVGVTTPLFNLPGILWNMVVLPMLLGTITTLKMLISIPMIGIQGNIVAEDITKEQALNDAMMRMHKSEGRM